MECRVYRLEYDTEEGPPSGVNSIKKGNKAGLRGKIDAGHQQGNGQDRWKGIKAGQFTALQTSPPHENRTKVAPPKANASDSKSNKYQERITFMRVDVVNKVGNPPRAKSIIPRSY